MSIDKIFLLADKHPVLFCQGRCLRGYYCPNGSSHPLPCDPGYYCQSDLLSKPTHECEAGWYCTSAAIESQPTDNKTGNICPTGKYCPKGSRTPQLCPIGTFLNTTGNRYVYFYIKFI